MYTTKTTTQIQDDAGNIVDLKDIVNKINSLTFEISRLQTLKQTQVDLLDSLNIQLPDAIPADAKAVLDKEKPKKV